MTINVPLYAFAQDGFNGSIQVDTIVLECQFDQQVIAPVNPGEEANQIPPNQTGYRRNEPM